MVSAMAPGREDGVFRECHEKARELRAQAGRGPEGSLDFVADFEIIARRALEPMDLRLFRMYFIDEKTGPEVRSVLAMSSEAFRGATSRIQCALGRAFKEARLFPIHEYFSGRQGGNGVGRADRRARCAVGGYSAGN